MNFAGDFQNRSGGLQAPIAFEIVGDNREMDLEFGFGKAEPSHASEAIAAFPGSEDFLDPGEGAGRFETSSFAKR